MTLVAMGNVLRDMQRLERPHTADDLGYNCDLRVIEDNIEILDEFILVGAVVEITDIENILDIHFLPSLLLKAFLVLIENLYCT